ncbi:MAG: sulfatase-like hydrolase/transferase [Victivallaceae bacterium]|nr:sulfatase-like hydrolase/transferase [Victivallaceae bacterium]
MTKKKNILFFMCDQLNPYVLSPYRENMAITPTYQQLADEGVVFENAFCNSPLCVPSRMSMMAGKPVSELNTFNNAGILNSDVPCFTHYLANAGYHTVLSGKMHFIGTDQFHGFGQRLTTDIYPAAGWVANWNNRPGGEGKKAILGDKNAPDWNRYAEYDELATTKAIEWIRKYTIKDASNDKPFFLCVSLTNPHHPYTAPKEFRDMYSDRDIPMPETKPLPLDKVEFLNDKWMREGHPWCENISDAEIREARLNYFAQTTFTDLKLKQMIDCLKKFNLYDDTWIIVTSDHSDMLGERGLFTKKHFCDQSIRVPLIVNPPKGTKIKKIKTNVSLLDMFPTFLDIAGTEEFPELKGESLLSFMDSSNKYELDRDVVIEYAGTSVLAPVYTICNAQFKYVNTYNPAEDSFEELLFDLENDPGESKNIITKDTSLNIVNTMRKKLAAAGWDGRALYSRELKHQHNQKLINEAESLSALALTCMPNDLDINDNDFYVRDKGMNYFPSRIVIKE